MATDFRLFSTLRYDPQLTAVPGQGLSHAGWNYKHATPIYMLDYHRDRLLKAASHWGWQLAVEALDGPSGLERLSRGIQDFVGPSKTGPLRLKVLVDRRGDVQFEKYGTAGASLEQLFPRSLPSPESEARVEEPGRLPQYILVVDSQGTPRSEHTHFKTTHRDVYDAARQRAEISPADLREVLTVSSDGYVIEGSITTPYFWRGGRWVTPPVSDGFTLSGGCGGQQGTSRRWALGRGLAVEEPVTIDSLVDGEECWLSNGARGFIFARIQI